jgi:hypothetical protein
MKRRHDAKTRGRKPKTAAVSSPAERPAAPPRAEPLPSARARHEKKDRHTKAVCKTCGKPAAEGTIMCADCVQARIPWHKRAVRKPVRPVVEGNGA